MCDGMLLGMQSTTLASARVDSVSIGTGKGVTLCAERFSWWVCSRRQPRPRRHRLHASKPASCSRSPMWKLWPASHPFARPIQRRREKTAGSRRWSINRFFPSTSNTRTRPMRTPSTSGWRPWRRKPSTRPGRRPASATRPTTRNYREIRLHRRPWRSLWAGECSSSSVPVRPTSSSARLPRKRLAEVAARRSSITAWCQRRRGPSRRHRRTRLCLHSTSWNQSWRRRRMLAMSAPRRRSRGCIDSPTAVDWLRSRISPRRGTGTSAPRTTAWRARRISWARCITKASAGRSTTTRRRRCSRRQRTRATFRRCFHSRFSTHQNRTSWANGAQRTGPSQPRQPTIPKGISSQATCGRRACSPSMTRSPAGARWLNIAKRRTRASVSPCWTWGTCTSTAAVG